MNPVSSIIFKWYLFLTILALVSSTTIGFISVLSGFILAWLIFTLFFLGANGKISLSFNKFHVSRFNFIARDARLYPLWAISIIAITSSLYASNFYTGKSIFEVFSALFLEISLYNDYQKYFASQGLATFSILKIPAIFSMFFIKFAAVYSFVCVLILTKKIKVSHCFWLFIISISSLYFSIARGTSFEAFELLLLLWFCLSMRAIRYEESKAFLSTSKTVFLLFSFAALALYSYNISARYSFGAEASCVTREMCLDSQTALHYFSYPLAMLSLKLSGYFTFGIYYTSVLINYYWLDGFSNFIQLILPFASFYENDLVTHFLCDDLLDCGAAWVPDAVFYILTAGFLLILFFAYLLGRFVRRLTISAFSSNDFICYVILYLVFLSLVSFPVGNFLTVSSANMLLLTLVSVFFLFRQIAKNI